MRILLSRSHFWVLVLCAWQSRIMTGRVMKPPNILWAIKVSGIGLCRKYHSSLNVLISNMYKYMHTAQSKPASNKCVQFITQSQRTDETRAAFWACQHLKHYFRRAFFLQKWDIGVLAVLLSRTFHTAHDCKTTTDDSDGSEGFYSVWKAPPPSNVRSGHWKIHEHNLDCVQAKQKCHLQDCLPSIYPKYSNNRICDFARHFSFISTALLIRSYIHAYGSAPGYGSNATHNSESCGFIAHEEKFVYFDARST